MNLATNLVRTVELHPDRVAVRLGQSDVTYKALDEATARVAGMLVARGLRAGERVGVVLPNVPEFAVVYYGVLRAGGVVVPMNPLLKAREVAYYLRDSQANLIFVWHAMAEEATRGAELEEAEAVLVDPDGFPVVLASAPPVPEVVERDDGDTAVILYTSGTTGHP